MSQTEPHIDQLQAWADEWQARLNLHHWGVAVRYVRRKDLSDSGHFAEAWINHEKQRVVIAVRRPEDADPIDDGDDYAEPDHEETVVHELLHCVVTPLMIRRKDHFNTLYEQSINRLARSLVEMKRASNRTGDQGHE